MSSLGPRSVTFLLQLSPHNYPALYTTSIAPPYRPTSTSILQEVPQSGRPRGCARPDDQSSHGFDAGFGTGPKQSTYDSGLRSARPHTALVVANKIHLGSDHAIIYGSQCFVSWSYSSSKEGSPPRLSRLLTLTWTDVMALPPSFPTFV
jgi:hypothetical protein